ncbi:MAG: glutaminyl-peptide cyclotransferase [Pyrinomonadaceae bacterium]
MVFASSCGDVPGSNGKPINRPANENKTALVVPQYSIEIVKTYPHDPKAFTQGLVFHNGFLYEGTGGKPARGDDFFSSLRKVELETGKVLQKYDVPVDFFGEGITVLDDKVYQLTWQERTAFVYDLSDFKLLREVRYNGEGWGLANDGTNLIMSDGTHVIRFLNPEDFTTVRTISVNDERGKPLMKLNELEYVNGEIWANVWETGWIVRIDPTSGKLVGRIDVAELVDSVQAKNPRADVLNGIAHDASADRIFITGKNWPNLYEIKVNQK